MNVFKQRLSAALAGICLLLAGCGAANQQSPTATPATASNLAKLCPNAAAPLAAPVVAGFGGAVDLWTLQPDGLPAAQLTALQPSSTISSIAWSRDGKTLAYTLTAPSPGQSAPGSLLSVICAFDRATGKGRLLAATSPGTQPSEISWLPDGAALLATYRYPIMDANNQFQGQGVAIARYDLAAGGEKVLIPEGYAPAPAPDGRSLAFVLSDPQVGFPALMLADIDGGNPRVLADPDPAFTAISSIRWSPDGKQLVFSARGGPTGGEGAAPAERSWLARLFGAGAASAHGETGSLWIIQSDGTGLRPLLPIVDDPLATWNPDGKTLLVSDWTEGLFTLDPATGEQSFLGVEAREFWALEWAAK